MANDQTNTEQANDQPKPAYVWRGQRTPGGGWHEYFAAPDGLPTRDLMAEDVAALSDAQRKKLESPTGQRLYATPERIEAERKAAADEAKKRKAAKE